MAADPSMPATMATAAAAAGPSPPSRSEDSAAAVDRSAVLGAVAETKCSPKSKTLHLPKKRKLRSSVAVSGRVSHLHLSRLDLRDGASSSRDAGTDQPLPGSNMHNAVFSCSTASNDSQPRLPTRKRSSTAMTPGDSDDGYNRTNVAVGKGETNNPPANIDPMHNAVFPGPPDATSTMNQVCNTRSSGASAVDFFIRSGRKSRAPEHAMRPERPFSFLPSSTTNTRPMIGKDDISPTPPQRSGSESGRSSASSSSAMSPIDSHRLRNKGKLTVSDAFLDAVAKGEMRARLDSLSSVPLPPASAGKKDMKKPTDSTSTGGRTKAAAASTSRWNDDDDNNIVSSEAPAHEK